MMEKKQEIINFLYYILDKIDEVYKVEVTKSIERFIKDLDKYLG